MSNSSWPHGLYSPWNFPYQNTGVGSLCLLQGIFPTQGSNPGLPRCRQILYQLSYNGSTRILEWVAFAFSRGSSQPRDWTQVSCIAAGFFTSWATNSWYRLIFRSQPKSDAMMPWRMVFLLLCFSAHCDFKGSFPVVKEASLKMICSSNYMTFWKRQNYWYS